MLPVTLTFRTYLILVMLLVSVLLCGAFWLAPDRGTTHEQPYVYVGLGASDSVGVGADNPATEGWVPRVHAGLPDGTRLVNLGISGATLADVVQQELPPALDARPRWVTLWSGVNDLRARVPLATFAQQLDEVLTQLRTVRTRPDGQPPTIAVLNIPDLRYLPAFQGVDPNLVDATVRAWNDAIAGAVERHDAILVDLYSTWPELAEHPEYISADGFHPSSAGYRRIAELVLVALEQDVSSSAR